jgi:hypothetical protein
LSMPSAQLHDHLKKVKAIHEKDLAEGWGRVVLSDALDRKYPNAPKDWRCGGSFPKNLDGRTPGPAKKAGIMFTSRCCNEPSKRPSAGPAWSNMTGATHSGIRSPRTSSKPVTTSDHPGTARSQGRRHHHDLCADLYARVEQGRPWGDESGRWPMTRLIQTA